MKVVDLPIAEIEVQDRIRRDMGDLEGLADSMRRLGLLHAVVVRDGDKRLLAGERRIEAAKLLEWDRIDAHLYESAAAYAQARVIESEENGHSKPFTPSERVEAARLVEAEAREAARDRQRAAGRDHGRGIASEKVSEAMGEDGRASAQAAASVGWSRPTYEKAKEVVDAAAADPQHADLVEQMDTTGKVSGAHDELRRRRGDPAMGQGQAKRGTADADAPMSHQEGYDSDEWYTPTEYTDAAREVLGEIDLDPASCHAAQERVRAARFFTKEDSGLLQPWAGRVWLNPPYSQPLASNFGEKLLNEIEAGNVTAAVMVQNASTDTGWFHRLASKCHMCLTRRRINFDRADGGSGANRYGQVFFYYGPDPERFYEVFGRFGLVGKLAAHGA